MSKWNLQAIVPHAFGDHASCGIWCGYKQKGELYKYKSFPGGKALENPALKLKMDQLIEKYVDVAERLAPCGTTQANESFNHAVASKCLRAHITPVQNRRLSEWLQRFVKRISDWIMLSE